MKTPLQPEGITLLFVEKVKAPRATETLARLLFTFNRSL
jgi:hypothetical protein